MYDCVLILLVYYRYRCNVGILMEGPDTIYCDGQYWNGTVPTCLVPPSSPNLSVSVSGSNTSSLEEQVVVVQTGDVVEAVCHASGGNPVPDVMISLPGYEGVWQSMSASAQIVITEEHSDGMIVCTVQNSAGTTHTHTTIHIPSKYHVL